MESRNNEYVDVTKDGTTIARVNGEGDTAGDIISVITHQQDDSQKKNKK